MKAWDVIVIGAGIIGLSLAISLRKQGLRVLIVERGEPGREASQAAAGMLVPTGPEIPPALKEVAAESAALYPEFVHELEDESGIKVDFREQGTVVLTRSEPGSNARELSARKIESMLPGLNSEKVLQNGSRAFFVPERSVDPRLLVSSALKAAQHRGVDVSSGSEVKQVLITGGRVAGIRTDKTEYSADKVVNCAGAWAGAVGPHKFPVHPVKGQMLAVVEGPALQRVVRADDVYIVPRADGRLVIGSTIENAGYDKHVNVDTIKRLFNAAVRILPELANSKQHEAWAGLRPGTPDCLPILGKTKTAGYFVASGHYRDGILLAPITGELLTAAVMGKSSRFDLRPFSPSRFT